MDEKEILKVGADAAIAPIKDVINRLFGPFADELGGLMADPIRVWRYQRSVKLFEKVARLSAARGIELRAVPLKTILPILENASVEEDEGLHNRWANLLANSAIDSDHALSFFPDALKRLGPIEAQLLDYVHDVAIEFSKRRFGSPQELREEELAVHSFSKILEAYKEIVGASPPVGIAAFAQPHMRPCLAALDVLMALGFVRAIPDPSVASPTQFSYSTTALGIQFVEACRTPKQPT
jgi:hypothetical protein